MREREQVSWENGFAVTLTKPTVLPEGGRSQLGKLRPLEMSMGVGLLGGKGVRERVVKLDGTESALSERVEEGRGDVWLQTTGPGFVNLAPGGSLRSKKNPRRLANLVARPGTRTAAPLASNQLRR